jgi:hypothetical protein
MAEEQLSIEVPGSGAITAVRTPASGARWQFLYAPGAGSNVHDPFGRYACRALAERGISCVRFQFPYMEAKRRSPDRTAVLETTWRAVIDALRGDAGRLAVGGRSMGGRIATHVAAAGVDVDALLLFAYPLHAPSKPDRWRDAHLPSVAAPALFCSGTRDSFAKPEELRAVASRMPDAAVHVLDGADHGFAVPKSSGRTREDVWEQAVNLATEWLERL